MQESSKKNVLRVISAQDSIEETEVSLIMSFADLISCSARVHLYHTYTSPDPLTLLPPAPGRRRGYEDHVNHGILYVRRGCRWLALGARKYNSVSKSLLC